jgi:hypothetical protein
MEKIRVSINLIRSVYGGLPIGVTTLRVKNSETPISYAIVVHWPQANDYFAV